MMLVAIRLACGVEQLSMNERAHKPSHPRWMTYVLRAAGVYNVVWGLFVIAAPSAMFRWCGMELPNYPQIWQCVGMIVGVYGVGYWMAARDPMRHWPIVLVGLLGKVLGPIGFAQALATGAFPLAFGVNIIFNDLMWWIPFAFILLAAMNHERMIERGMDVGESPAVPLVDALRAASVSGGSAGVTREGVGVSLAELSRRGPVLVVLLRHFGCTFCREAMAEVGSLCKKLEHDGVTLVFVHMGSQAEGAEYLAQHGHSGSLHVSDPQRTLYRSLGLGQGSPWQLFGPAVMLRGFIAGVIDRHGVGKLVGDGFQMPGVFLLHNEQVVRSFRHAHAGSRPDYAALSCPLPT